MSTSEADPDQTDRLPVLEAEDATFAESGEGAGTARLSTLDPDGDALGRALELAHAELRELGASGESLRSALAFAHAEIAELGERLGVREQELAAQRAGAEARAQAVAHGATAQTPDGADLAAELRDAQARCTRYLEALQSREWRRGVFEERVRALEDELEPLRRRSREFDAERAHLNATVETLRAQLAAMPAATAPVAPGSAADSGEWRANAAAREAELEVERAARLVTERALSASEAQREQQLARITELEGFGVGLGRALQTQTEAAHASHAEAVAHERAVAELRARIGHLEEALLAAQRDGHARAASEAGAGAAELAELTARLGQAERESRAAAAAAGAEIESLHSRQHELVLQLERTRGALEERDLQIRRLERNLSRRYADAPAAGAERAAEPADPAGSGAAALVPLDGSIPRFLERGRRTRIGRASDNDICIEDASVSRHHAVIVNGPTGTFIEDLDSVNGVGVNGRRIRHARLSEGDFVTLGTMRFRFSVEARSLAQG